MNEIAGAEERGDSEQPKKRAMLAALAKTGNVTAAATAAKVGRTSHYRWIDEDLEYKAAAKEAMEQAADLLESEARRRAETGVLEPVYHAGVKVGTIRRYSDTLLIFLLKGARPEKNRERHEISGTVRHVAPGNLTNLSDDELEQLDALAEKLAVE